MSGSTRVLDFGEEFEDNPSRIQVDDEEDNNENVVIIDVEEIKRELFTQCSSIKSVTELKTFLETTLAVGLQAHNRGCTLTRVNKWFVKTFNETEYSIRTNSFAQLKKPETQIFWNMFKNVTDQQFPTLLEEVLEGFRPQNKKQRRNSTSNDDSINMNDDDENQNGFTVLNRYAFVAHACIDEANYDTFRALNTKDDNHQKHNNLDSGMQSKSEFFYRNILEVAEKNQHEYTNQFVDKSVFGEVMDEELKSDLLKIDPTKGKVKVKK